MNPNPHIHYYIQAMDHKDGTFAGFVVASSQLELEKKVKLYKKKYKKLGPMLKGNQHLQL